jgi:peptide/nickel transport system substrate-binding protein
MKSDYPFRFVKGGTMKIKKKRLALLGVLGVFFLLPAVLFASPDLPAGNPEANQGWRVWGEETWPTKPVHGGYFRRASRFYIGMLNPNHFPVWDWSAMLYMYDRLIINDSNFKPTVPWLAESWEYLDPVTVRMKLRQGVKFHDGSPFNAEGVKYQMEWIKDKKNGAWTRSWLEPLESVEVIDEYTLKWHFKRPWGSFLGSLASVPGIMISAKALKADRALADVKRMTRRAGSVKREAAKAEEAAQEAAARGGGEEAWKARAEAEKARKEMIEFEARLKEATALAKGAKPLDTNPVGTGKFMFEKASPGNYIMAKRNPDWWFGKTIGHPDMPYFDGFKVSVIPDASVRLANLKANRIDWAVLNAPMYRLVKNDQDLNLAVIPLNWLIYMMLNHADGPCQDIRIRKAISHAIDREALVHGTQFGMGRVASCIYPDNHWTHNPNLKPVSYDPELSKKLLAEAGYADGLTVRGFTGNMPEALAFSKAIMGMLEKVGIKWDVEFLGIAAMAEPLKRLDFDMNAMLFPWISEPDDIARILYEPDGLMNNGRSRNEKAMALIKAGREEIDVAKRVKIYHQLEEALYENYEDVWLFYPKIVLVTNKNLRGIDRKLAEKYREPYIMSHPRWFKDGTP